MRGLINFDVGELLTLDGQEVRFESLVPPVNPRLDGSDDLQFLDARHRRATILSPEEFLTAYADGRVRYHRLSEKPGDEVGEDERPTKAMRRRWRFFWTTAFDKSPVSKSTEPLRNFISQHQAEQPDPVDPPSPHTLRRWLRERGQQDDRRPRLMGDRRSPRLPRPWDHEFVQTAYETASRRYWSNYRVTFQDLQIDVRAAVHAENRRREQEGQTALRVPSRTTLWRRLRAERTFENILTREGRHVAERQFKAIRNSLCAKRILDVAIIDHKLMDVHLCDANTGFVIGRPWLAVAMDVKSRMVLGYSLSYEDPSVLSAMACVRAAMRGRPEIKRHCRSVEGEWEAFGVPRTILADNAWENTGSSFADACADNGISIEWAPVRRPEHKGILERFFSRLDDQLVHKLPGAVIDHPYALARRRIDPQSDATLTFKQLEEFLCRYIVDVYSQDIHAGINDVPLRVWRESAKRDGIELAVDLTAVEHAMGKLVRDRTLNHAGVMFKNLTYRSYTVDRLLADLLPLQAAKVRSGSARVKIKYHPEDLSRIFVWNEARNRYVVLPCIDQEYAHGLSERVHEELQRRTRDANNEFTSEAERLAAKAALHREILESYPNIPLKERRRRARMLGKKADITSGETIAIDPISNRDGGDQPEKAAVRSRKTKQTKREAPADHEEFVLFDPFADRDRAMVREKSLERLA